MVENSLVIRLKNMRPVNLVLDQVTKVRRDLFVVSLLEVQSWKIEG